MGRRSAHPDKKLFAHLSGRLDQQDSQAVEEHLSNCNSCATVAALVRGLKSEKSQISTNHPDVSEIAALFYGESTTKHRSKTAAHIARCRSCADEMAQYA